MGEVGLREGEERFLTPQTPFGMTRLRDRRSRSQKRSEVFDEHDLVARFVVDEFVDHLLCEK
jgi:hypothetical protein